MANYYQLLHVQPDAPTAVIKASYRALIQRLHPDHGGDSAYAAIVNQAYDTLTDPVKREKYDKKERIERWVEDCRSQEEKVNTMNRKACADVGDTATEGITKGKGFYVNKYV